jgi:hypothetical protein
MVTVILTALSALLVTFIGIYGNNRLEESVTSPWRLRKPDD